MRHTLTPNVAVLGINESRRVLYWNPTCSIGITLFNPDANSFESILARADEAMYEAKKAGQHTSHCLS